MEVYRFEHFKNTIPGHYGATFMWGTNQVAFIAPAKEEGQTFIQIHAQEPLRVIIKQDTKKGTSEVVLFDDKARFLDGVIVSNNVPTLLSDLEYYRHMESQRVVGQPLKELLMSTLPALAEDTGKKEE